MKLFLFLILSRTEEWLISPHKCIMKKIIRIMVMSLLVLSVGLNAFAIEKTITVRTAGTLEELLGDNKAEITKLTLKGELNNSDFSVLQWMADSDGSLEVLDMEEVEGLTKIINRAFWDCRNITSICLPEGITEIGESAFAQCPNLTSINIPKSVKRIKGAAFRYCENLSTVVIPKGVTVIEWELFEECSMLSSVSIPEGVTEIEECAFNTHSYNLTSITLPKTLKKIGWKAFWAYGLSSVTCEATEPPVLERDAFRSYTGRILYVPEGCVEKYKGSDWNNYFYEIIEIGTFPTNNEQIEITNPSVYAVDNGIQIQTEKSTLITIYNIAGQLIKQKKATGMIQIDLTQGTYIVKIGKHSKIVLVK